MTAFRNKSKIRLVEVPDDQINDDKMDTLEAIFCNGQNYIQPLELPSVSVGDIIGLDDEYWLVLGLGFEQITKEKFDSIGDDEKLGTMAYGFSQIKISRT